MPRFFLEIIFVISLVLPGKAKAAESLLERAPNLDTLHQLLTPAPLYGKQDRLNTQHQRALNIFILAAKARRTTPSIERWQTIYKLSNLILEKSLDVRDFAQSRYETAFDRYFIGDAPAIPTLELDAYRETLLQAVNYLRDIAENTQSRFRRDEISFLIATTLARIGNDHCEVYFKQVIDKSNPNIWSILASIAKNDYLVAKDQFDPAIRGYSSLGETIEKSEGKITSNLSMARLKSYIEYRRAWAIIKKNWEAPEKLRKQGLIEASHALRNSINLAKQDQTGHESRIKIATEASHDFLWILAILSEEKQAQEFLDVANNQELTNLYREIVVVEALNKKNFDLASRTLNTIIADTPNFTKIPDLTLRLARAYSVAGLDEAKNRELQQLSKFSTDPDNLWYRSHKNQPEKIARVQRMTELFPLSGGLHLVRSASNETDPARKSKLLNRGVDELTKYLSTQKNDSETNLVRLTRALALIELDRKQEALTELDTLYAIEDQDTNQRQAIATERLNLVIKLDSVQVYQPLPAPGEVKKPLPLPDLKQRFARYAEDYLRLIPGDPQALSLQFQTAQDLFLYGHYDEALSRFESIVNNYPSSDQAKTAIEVLLSMNVKRARWDELIRLSTSFLNNRAVKGRALRDYVRQNLDYAKSQKR